MTHKRKSNIVFIIGVLLLVLAICITANNIFETEQARNASEKIVNRIIAVSPNNYSVSEPDEDQGSIAGDISEIYNEQGLITDAVKEEYLDYSLLSQMDMPIKEVDGRDYIGVLDIPTLGLSLPILSDYNYKDLRVAPCRYTGSAYTKDLVICAHNYNSHFGTLKNMSVGDALSFTDISGNVIKYIVEEIIVLNPSSVEEFTESGYALSLFTCTVGGASRVAVRCSVQA